MHEQKAGSGLPDVAEPRIDLGVGDTAAMLAWASYLLADQLDAVSPLLRERIAHECRRRVLAVLLERDDHYWQTAVNNWNPWIISNILATALLVESDRPFRDAVLTKAVATLDFFVDHYPADGGCDEGPTYWTRAGGNLILCLDLLHSATGGDLDVYAEPLIGAIGRYVHRMFIGDDWFVNFADGAGRFTMPSTAWRYGVAIGDEALTRLGYEHLRRSVQGEPPRFLESFPSLLPLLPHLAELAEAAPAEIPLVRDAVFPDIQVLVARDKENSAHGWFLAVKGGHNDEVHNHNDVGSIVVFLDGQPLLIDAGVGPYTRATFSHERYTIWTMQSGWHNVPVINGVEQKNGKSFAAKGWTTSVTDAGAEATSDIVGAYPAECGATRWERTVGLVREQGIDITDRFAFAADGARVELHLLTNVLPDVLADAAVRIGGAVAQVVSDGPVEIRITPREVEEVNIAAIWGETIYRVDFVATALPREGQLRLELRRA